VLVSGSYLNTARDLSKDHKKCSVNKVHTDNKQTQTLTILSFVCGPLRCLVVPLISGWRWKLGVVLLCDLIIPSRDSLHSTWPGGRARASFTAVGLLQQENAGKGRSGSLWMPSSGLTLTHPSKSDRTHTHTHSCDCPLSINAAQAPTKSTLLTLSDSVLFRF